MATPASPRFLRLVNVWKLLCHRSDVDNIILELLGRFSLEKIYAGSDKQTYQRLVTILLVQLNAIFHVQRVSLPGEASPGGLHLGMLASWEVIMRSVEFILQTMVDGRESLCAAQQLGDKYLGETLLLALRILMLHPKPSVTPRARERRDRYARVHNSLEHLCEKNPTQRASLLLVCRETTNWLRADPDALALPPKLKLPDLRSNMYPLADCLSPQYVAMIASPKDPSGAWLPSFLMIRDVSLFVLGASLQCATKAEFRTDDLRSASSGLRETVLRVLEDFQLPPYLSKVELSKAFDRIFSLMLPDTSPLLSQDMMTEIAVEDEVDALVLLHTTLCNRQILQRANDRGMRSHISEVTRQISVQDDPSGHYWSTTPTMFVVNCPSCHVVGGSQLKKMTGNDPWTAIDCFVPNSGGEILLDQTNCVHCGGTVTVAREISLARNAWNILKPLGSESDTLDVERHLATTFQLSPPSIDATNARSEHSHVRHAAHATHADDSAFQTNDPSPPYQNRAADLNTTSSDRFPSTSAVVPVVIPSPNSHNFGRRLDTLQPNSPLGVQHDHPISPSIAAPTTPDIPFSPDDVGVRHEAMHHPEILDRLDVIGVDDPVPWVSSNLLSHSPPLVKQKSRWRSKWTVTRKNSTAATGDTSSLSSATLEAQKLEEISLESLLRVSKSSLRGRIAKKVNVHLSHNATYALFWTQAAIHVWDIGISPPATKRTFSTESSCVLAAVTKIHLAYIIGTRDQKLTLRVVNLEQPSLPVVEHRMSSSLWCRSIAICPNEEYVAVGFDNSIVRFFRLANSEQPREYQLHSRYHKDCRDCPSVDTLSFSNDGFILLASTRNRRSGTIQIFSWKSPFLDFQEFQSCRYNVPLLESEDNGISAALPRSGAGEEDLICITTWTQSGVPVLLQAHDGHKTEIKTDLSGRQGKLGNRIQCAAFSDSGKELAMVNDKGYLYHITNLDSTPMQMKRMATSIELTAKSDAFAMAFMTLQDEEAIVLAWADMVKSVCLVKKIPIMPHGDISPPPTPAVGHVSPQFELPSNPRVVAKAPVELPADTTAMIMPNPPGVS